MTIKAVKVVRDTTGFFSHPDFPAWDESTSQKEINDWFHQNGGVPVIIDFENDADGYLVDAWFDTDGTGTEELTLLKWEPTCDKFEGAFLLSIHDTEAGPMAIFFHPFHVGE
jgi:hypothetical protein